MKLKTIVMCCFRPLRAAASRNPGKDWAWGGVGWGGGVAQLVEFLPDPHIKSQAQDGKISGDL